MAHDSEGYLELPTRLALNLIPKSMWGKNVRAVVAAETWDTLRWLYDATADVRRINLDIPTEIWAERSDYRPTRSCKICGHFRRSLELHEEWVFDDVARSQRLEALIAICPKCHLAKHLGHAHLTGRSAEALDHLAAVNLWSLDEAVGHAQAALELWFDRSSHEYTLDLSILERVVPKTKIHLDWLGSYHSWFGSRLDSILWAREILNSDAVIIDTETTGLPKLADDVEVIELAAIDVRGEVLFDSLFRPRASIPNSHIHRITDRMTSRAPTFAERWPEIAALFRGRNVVSYNARFDRPVMDATCLVYGLDPPDCRWNCAMQAWWTFEGLPYTKLPGGAHRALADARAALTLIKTMAEASDFHFD